MLIVHVFINVKSDKIDAFKYATLQNANNSVNEPGVVRFDIIQERDDKTKFVLVEVYRSAQDAGAHKETAHYISWRDAVAEMMAEPRKSIKYSNIFPEDNGW